MNGYEFKEKYNNIADNVEKILTKQPLTIDEQNMIKILSLFKEIIKPNDKKKQMNNQILQTCLNQKVKNLLNKEEINKEKV